MKDREVFRRNRGAELLEFIPKSFRLARLINAKQTVVVESVQRRFNPHPAEIDSLLRRVVFEIEVNLTRPVSEGGSREDLELIREHRDRSAFMDSTVLVPIPFSFTAEVEGRYVPDRASRRRC